jgi:Zn-dependent peptidase ImmA (M78 family)
MQNISSKKIKSNIKNFRKISPPNLPAAQKFYYYFCILYFISYYGNLIADIINKADDNEKLPISIKYLEKYLPCYKFKYIGFPADDPRANGINGFYQADGDTVYIFFNKDLSKARIKFTKVHEIFHFFQSIDPQAIKIFNDLMKYCGPNEDIIYTLNEEAADMATFIYLMPPEYFDKKSQEIKNTYKDLIKFMTSRLRESIKSI